MGTERIQDGYRTEMERIRNGYESQKCKKSVHHNTNYKRTCSSEHMLVIKLRHESVYQGFGHDVTLNKRASNFCSARRSWENDRADHLMSFFISPASSGPFRVHRGHFVIVNKLKLCPNKEMDGRVELDWDWKVSSRRETKQQHRYFGWSLFTVLFTNFAEGSVRITFNLN